MWNDVGSLLRFAGFLTDELIRQSANYNEAVNEAKEEYADFTGIAYSDEQSMLTMPRCGVKDVPGERQGQVCRWRDSLQPIKYFIGSIPILSATDWRDVFDEATGAWSDVCGMQWIRVDDENKANVLIFSGKEDGPGNTLAWCQLPCGNARRIQLKMDAQESWVKSNPRGNQIDAVAVACHELGHGIGMDHIPANQAQALLNPYYSSRIRRPLAADIAVAVKLYGTPKNPKPPTPPDPSNPVSVSVLIDLGGKKYSGTVQEVN